MFVDEWQKTNNSTRVGVVINGISKNNVCACFQSMALRVPTAQNGGDEILFPAIWMKLEPYTLLNMSNSIQHLLSIEHNLHAMVCKRWKREI